MQIKIVIRKTNHYFLAFITMYIVLMIKQTRKRILNVLEKSEVPKLLIAQAMIRAISIKVDISRFNLLFFSF